MPEFSTRLSSFLGVTQSSHLQLFWWFSSLTSSFRGFKMLEVSFPKFSVPGFTGFKILFRFSFRFGDFPVGTLNPDPARIEFGSESSVGMFSWVDDLIQIQNLYLVTSFKRSRLWISFINQTRNDNLPTIQRWVYCSMKGREWVSRFLFPYTMMIENKWPEQT